MRRSQRSRQEKRNLQRALRNYSQRCMSRLAQRQTGAQGAGPDMGAGAGPAPEGFQGDDVVDGDYKEV